MNLTAEILVLNTILAHHRELISEPAVMEKSRGCVTVYQRAVLIYYLKKRGYTLTAIGNALKLHHATIIHALKYPRKYGRLSGYEEAIKEIDNASIPTVIVLKNCPCCNRPVKSYQA